MISIILFTGDKMKYKCLEKLNPKNTKGKSKIMFLINKCLTAILIGIIALIVMEYSPKFKTFINEEVLGKNISFGFLGKIYNKYFGKVLPTSSSDKVVEVFNEKITYTNKEKYLDGFKLTVDNNYLIPIINSGIVVFIGEKEGYGHVITIEQEDGITITYGNILNSNIKLYDYVTKGNLLGEAKDNTLYISILKDGEYQDFETYIS